MRPIFTCEACGFISTLGSEFVRASGHLFDKECWRAYEAKEEPQARWVSETPNKTERKENERA
ncbi:hypothetical protein CKA34_10830 [Rhizobium sp. 11515TR]|nr:hypothetical protein CKA34_10830 [Rhizobium sp. 11515TR]